ncbi:hypothetical protein [Brevundimonas diminuta]|uniref:hypothetical protein n=1 Tax=Brevundimonas diminuta TaxID=293 RepID=UPI003D01B81A
MTEVVKRVGQFFRQINRLPGRTTQLERKVDRLLKLVIEQKRENLLMLDALSLPSRDQWLGQPPLISGEPGQKVFDAAAMCRQDSFRQPYFSYWTQRLGESLRYHRKLWEFVFIAQALWERGVVTTGRKGLGFGVGTEPLSAFFASQGVKVMATDLMLEGAVSLGWTQTNQHAAGKEALRKPAICPDDLFDRNVEFRACDMNAVPDDLTGYDFCWSACALEHLGSIDKGLTFIERSVQCLKPGGWAIHTTEFNVLSNLETVDHMETVLFRRRDLEALAERLRAQGHFVAPIDWNPGAEPLDRYYDIAPYKEQPHLKVALSGFAATSIGFIVQRGQ